MSMPTEVGWYWWQRDEFSFGEMVKVGRDADNTLAIWCVGISGWRSFAECPGTFVGPLLAGLLTEAQREQAWERAMKYAATVAACCSASERPADVIEGQRMPPDWLRPGSVRSERTRQEGKLPEEEC